MYHSLNYPNIGGGIRYEVRSVIIIEEVKVMKESGSVCFRDRSYRFIELETFIFRNRFNSN